MQTLKQSHGMLAHIYGKLGEVVVLALPSKTKELKQEGWQTVTFKETLKPAYTKKLEFAEVNGNLAVLLGPPSGNVVTIDCDNDELFEMLPKVFPVLQHTLRTRGAHGGQIWFRMIGKYPERRETWLKLEKRNTVDFRGGGGYSVISGIHKDSTPENLITYRQDWGDKPLLELEWKNVLVIKEWVKLHQPEDEEVDSDESDLSWTRDFPDVDFYRYNWLGLLQALGLNPKSAGGDKYSITCPWKHEHSADTGARETVVWLGDHKQWLNFNCLHAHCANRGTGALLRWAEEQKPGIVRKFAPKPEVPAIYEEISNLELVGFNSMLEGEEVETPPELICSVLHKGLKMMIAGRSKSMKSWLCKGLGLSLATGTRWLGFVIPAKFRVLYLNLEIPGWSIQKRIRSIARSMTISEARNLQFLNLRGVQLHSEKTDIWKEFIDKVKSLGEWDCIIIDPVYKLAIERDENTARGVSSICFDMDRLAEATGAAIIYVHHFAKGNESFKEMQDRMSGSGVWLRDPDVYMCLSRHQEDHCFSVEWEIRNNPPIKNFVVEWDGNRHCHTMRDDLYWEDLKRLQTKDPKIKAEEEKAKEAAKEMKLMDFVNLIPEGGFTSSKWEKACGLTRTPYDTWRKKALAKGLVIKNEDGKYVKHVFKP